MRRDPIDPTARQDPLVAAIGQYAASFVIESAVAFETARCCLVDALACGLQALGDPACASLIGPSVPGAVMPGGARVPGTSFELDPAQAAFSIGILTRWLDGAAWLTPERGHSTDGVGSILATADYLARKAIMEGRPPPKVREVLASLVKAREIQGRMALAGGADRMGREATLLAGIASVAVVAAQLGGTAEEISSAVANALTHGVVAIHRKEPCSRSSECWIAADGASRAVRLACLAMAAVRAGHPSVLAIDGGEAGEGLFGAERSDIPPRFGTQTIERIASRRSAQDVPQLMRKFGAAVDRHYPAKQAQRIHSLFAEPARLDGLPVNELVASLVTHGGK